MDKLKSLQNPAWSKPDWPLPGLSEDAKKLLQKCAKLPSPELTSNIDELIQKSDEFPIEFPIESVRLKTLKRKISTDTLKNNIVSTYPLVHERVLRLMAQFLVYKREHGSSIERDLYRKMSVPDLIDRILKKRAMSFMSRHDKYMLITGERGNNGWEEIGTSKQKSPLTLDKCLSYDELKLSAMVYVSSYTVCINDGARKNKGVEQEEGVEESAVIIGVIGPRFQREARVDNEDILITEKQNCTDNGFGKVKGEKGSKALWRKLWADFYEKQSYTFEDAKHKLTQQPSNRQKLKKDERLYTDSFVTVGKEGAVFDNCTYHKRLNIITDCSLLEAEARGSEAGKSVFLNVIGCGLGVWKISPHQNDVYVLSFVERVRALLRCEALPHVTDINFAYIKASKSLKSYFTTNKEGVLTSFIPSKEHPKGGIHIYLEDREPSSRLAGAHEGKLLVMQYPWDGNAHPGNEFWIGKLGSSGDPAAACSTQISELHNAYINPAVSGHNTRVISQSGLKTLREYCAEI